MWRHFLAAGLVWKWVANTFSLGPSGHECRQKKSHEMINSSITITIITISTITIITSSLSRWWLSKWFQSKQYSEVAGSNICSLVCLHSSSARPGQLSGARALLQTKQFQIPVFVFVFGWFVFLLGYLKYLHLFHPCCSNNPSDPPLVSPPTQRSCYKRHFSKIFSHSSI